MDAITTTLFQGPEWHQAKAEAFIELVNNRKADSQYVWDPLHAGGLREDQTLMSTHDDATGNSIYLVSPGHVKDRQVEDLRLLGLGFSAGWELQMGVRIDFHGSNATCPHCEELNDVPFMPTSEPQYCDACDEPYHVVQHAVVTLTPDEFVAQFGAETCEETYTRIRAELEAAHE